MNSKIDFTAVEKVLGYTFKKKSLLKLALTHSSYANEMKVESNERLEFLGDAVIEFIITERLYNEYGGDEGTLSKIRAMVVSEKPLAEVTKKLGLDKFLVKGVGESRNKTESLGVNCDLFEAICGAIYLDGGIDSVRVFFNMALKDTLNRIKVQGFVNDAKSELQESLKSAKILYSTKKTGLDHNPHYTATVFVNDVKMGSGEGSNKKTAEENAASAALNNLKKI